MFFDSKPALSMIFAQVRLCDLCLLALAFRWPLLPLHWGTSSELAAICDRSKEGREQPERLCQGLCQGLRGDEVASCAQSIQRGKHESDKPLRTCDCFPSLSRSQNVQWVQTIQTSVDLHCTCSTLSKWWPDYLLDNRMKAKTLRWSKFRNSSPESKVWFRDTSSSSCWLLGDTYEHIHVVHVANSRISCIIPDARLFWFRHIICSNQLWPWSCYGSSGAVAPLWFVNIPSPRKLEVSSSRESESLCGEPCAPRWGGRADCKQHFPLIRSTLPIWRRIRSRDEQFREQLESSAETTWSNTLRIQMKCGLDVILMCFQICIWVKQKRGNSRDAHSVCTRDQKSLGESGEHAQ